MTGELDVILVAGGVAPSGELLTRTVESRRAAHPAARRPIVVAVDAGLDACTNAGIEPDVAIGDFDSASEQALRAARNAGTQLVAHQADKDASDLELALGWVAELGETTVSVTALGVNGGRFDHELVAFAVLTGWASERRSVKMIAENAQQLVVVAGVAHIIEVAAGDTVTLLAIGGDADGVTTTGLQWPLADATLTPFSSWGLSNVATADAPTVSCTSGRLLAMASVPPLT